VAVGAAALAVAAGWRLPRTLPLLAALLLLRCVPDRALWQSYLLEQTATLLLAAWALRAPATRAGDALVALRLMLALLFLWAGLHKLNPTFIDSGLGSLLAPVGIESTPSWLNGAAAVLESLLGAALLLRRTRRAASLALVAFSLTAAAALLVLGLNRAVVPWNLAHALVLLLLFRRVDRPAVALRPAPIAIGVVFGLLPLLHPLGVPSYLALRLYTGSSLHAVLYIDDVAALPAPARAVAASDNSGTFAAVIPIETWAHEATGAFVPPDDPVFAAVTSRVCARVPNPDRVLAVVSAPPDWSGRARDTRYLRCP
jgi:uncharacterized membrane protein YphA (DoxX/SURF4 family)